MRNLKKAIIFMASLVLLPLYGTAYGLSRLLKLRGYEDMETLEEWLTLYKDVDFNIEDVEME